MSSDLYRSRLLWDSHTHRGCAKLDWHEAPIDRQPVICGQGCDCDMTPDVGVYRIKRPFEGWADMSHEEIVDADRLLRILIPPDDSIDGLAKDS